MLSESVIRRQKQLEDCYLQDENGPHSNMSESVQMVANEGTTDVPSCTLNIESLLLIENKLGRLVQSTRLLNPVTEYSTDNQIEVHNMLCTEIVDLCEEFWVLIRTEARFLTQSPKILFDETDQSLIESINVSHCYQLIVVSLLGYVVSQNDYTFLKSHFCFLTYIAHKSFVLYLD